MKDSAAGVGIKQMNQVSLQNVDTVHPLLIAYTVKE